MATRSHIGILEGDKVKFVYCHYDGYLSHNGNMLKKYYNTSKKVHQLLDNGSLSILNPLIKPWLIYKRGKKHKINIGFTNNFNKADQRYCVFYHRDRGDDLEIYWCTVNDYATTKHIDVLYLFIDNKWHYYNPSLKKWELV